MATRRDVLVLGGAALMAGACAPKPPTPTDVDARLGRIEAMLGGGRLGVCAIDTGSGARIVHRGDDRFAMASTFKWLLAAAVLKNVDAGGMSLDQRVLYSETDLLDYAPVTKEHLAEGGMTVEQLLEAIITVSDNTAANLLLPGVMGPEGLTAFLRANGDAVTRLDRTEPTLNENAPGDLRDTTTPVAMAQTLQHILVGGDGLAGGDVLTAASRERLIGWMEKTSTGLKRLRAGFPGWRAGDKTGSGANGAVNDCAIVWPPEKPAKQKSGKNAGPRKPIVIASYISEGDAGPETREAIHAAVGSVIAQAWG
jgi:beta-lactamase class A